MHSRRGFKLYALGFFKFLTVTPFPWDLVNGTARTFALSLRLLPTPVREPIALAYLLARLTDTEADGAATPQEALLLERRSELLKLLRESPEKESIQAVWQEIQRGQEFDRSRFTEGSPPLSSTELDSYAHWVAGSAGEFWTRICFRRLPGFSKLPEDEMLRLGEAYGRGLQLVNILRDRAADAQRGRIYVPESDFVNVLVKARELLEAGEAYWRAIRKPRRLRAAVALPWRLAQETLKLIEAEPRAPRVKISRARVWMHALAAWAS